MSLTCNNRVNKPFWNMSHTAIHMYIIWCLPQWHWQFMQFHRIRESTAKMACRWSNKKNRQDNNSYEIEQFPRHQTRTTHKCVHGIRCICAKNANKKWHTEKIRQIVTSKQQIWMGWLFGWTNEVENKWEFYLNAPRTPNRHTIATQCAFKRHYGKFLRSP